MGLKQQIETLREWACEKVKGDCYRCEYSTFDEYDCCPFSEVIQAAEDREKEEPETIPHGIIVRPRTMYEAMRDTVTPITADVKVDESGGLRNARN